MEKFKEWEVRVSFHTNVFAKHRKEVDRQIEELLSELGDLKTTLDWDDCEWETTEVERKQ